MRSRRRRCTKFWLMFDRSALEVGDVVIVVEVLSLEVGKPFVKLLILVAQVVEKGPQVDLVYLSHLSNLLNALLSDLHEGGMHCCQSLIVLLECLDITFDLLQYLATHNC